MAQGKLILFTYTNKGIRFFKRRYFFWIIFLFILFTLWSLEDKHKKTDLKESSNGRVLISKVKEVGKKINTSSVLSEAPHRTSKAPVLPTQIGELPVILKWGISQISIKQNITCSSLRCHVTNNRDVRHHQDLLAIHFHGTRFRYVDLPLPRKPGHLWSLMHEESPKHNSCQFCAKDSMSLFNLTSTFKRESNYPIPTMWLPDERVLTSKEFVVPLKKKNQFRREGLAPVVFVHSDCNNPSDREHYMRLLQQYIQIDSYGKCEHNKEFPRANLSGMSPDKFKTANFYNFVSKYKFAFAFENFVCDDYLTEKFWRPLQLGIVPLVFGSPKVKDFAPSDHSIIDIRDFRSVKEVADYITFLDTNDEQYAKYLDFKRTGITNPTLKLHLNKRDWGFGKTHSSFFNGFNCFICEKLHSLRNQMVSGQPMEQWIGKQDHYSCPKPKSFDEHGKYLIEQSSWLDAFRYSSYLLKSFRYHISHNIDADKKKLHAFAQDLQRQDKTRKNLLRGNI